MFEHHVIVYVKDDTKRFSITARKTKARLPEVDQQQMAAGYTKIVLAKNLRKVDAEARKKLERADYIRRGYTYVPRPQL